MRPLVIFFHGTSQDNLSKDENTVQLMELARRENYFVEELGGPGSTHRAIKTMIEDTGPGIFTMGESLDDVGSIGLEWLVEGLGGVAFGRGVERNIEEAVRIVGRYRKQGVKKIYLVGFSRGAYTIGELLPVLERLGLLEGLEVQVALMDPVHGPGRPKLHTVPPSVKKIQILYSQHEGRPGFARSEFIVSPRTLLDGQTLIGVHGDVGGSTRSPVARLAKDEVSAFLFNGRRALSPLERIEAIVAAMMDHERYTMTPLAHALSPRVERPTSGVGYVDRHDIVIPLPSADETLWSESSLWRMAVTSGPTARRITPQNAIDRIVAEMLEDRARALQVQKYAHEQRERLRQQAQFDATMARMERAQEAFEEQQRRREHRPQFVQRPMRLARDPSTQRVVDIAPVRMQANTNVLLEVIDTVRRHRKKVPIFRLK